jgi:predicted transcriptional regulator
MKAWRFKIKIESLDKMKRDFARAFHLARRRKAAEPGYDLVLSFPDASAISKVLSPERIRILQTVRDYKPESVRQLAKLLGREQSNVQKDIQELAQLGVIELKRTRKKGQKRESVQPEYNWDGFDIAV